MTDTFSGIVIASRFLQPLKALLDMVLSLLDSFISLRALQPLNTSELSVAISSPIVTFVSEEQRKKTKLPNTSSLSGSLTSVREEQFENAPSLISITLSPMETSASLSQ